MQATRFSEKRVIKRTGCDLLHEEALSAYWRAIIRAIKVKAE
jgi:hypothetical protein